MSSRKKKRWKLSDAYLSMMKSAKGSELGLSAQSLWNARTSVIRGEYPKDTTMRKRLLKAKWRKVQDEQWEA